MAHPFVYRNHDKPDAGKMGEFMEFLHAIGFEHKMNGRMTSKKLSRFMDSIIGTDKEHIIQNILLRSLMKARYETRNIGHFGLAFKRYTHFTSPIRRYPDLVVHRALKHYLRHGWIEENRDSITKRFEGACEQANERSSLRLRRNELHPR